MRYKNVLHDLAILQLSLEGKTKDIQTLMDYRTSKVTREQVLNEAVEKIREILSEKFKNNG